MRALRFWARVAKAAFLRACTVMLHTKPAILFGAVTLFLVIGVLASDGREDAAFEEFVKAFVVVLVTLAGLVLYWLCVMLRIPAEWDAEKSEQIREFKTRLKPGLKIDFVPRQSHFEVTRPPGAGGRAHRRFRIRVTNTGPAALAHCCVRLDSLIDGARTDSGETNRSFRIMGNKPSSAEMDDNKHDFVLAPGDHEWIDVVEMDETQDQGVCTLCFATAPDETVECARLDRSKGPYQLTLRVVGAATPAFCRLRFDVGQDGILRMLDLGPPEEPAAQQPKRRKRRRAVSPAPDPIPAAQS